jgi:hypothetical protein
MKQGPCEGKPPDPVDKQDQEAATGFAFDQSSRMIRVSVTTMPAGFQSGRGARALSVDRSTR